LSTLGAGMTFSLDPRLTRDTYEIGDLPLCRALLMNDARFPWAILVPRRPDLAEIVDLDAADRGLLIEELARASAAIRAEAGVEKINVGALGNIVRQLHVHVVGRNAADDAWPGTVWGSGPARAYVAPAREALADRLRRRLGLC
jgi:diadenosine tetraphosphate (Ap4A) HIT family hydrolase